MLGDEDLRHTVFRVGIFGWLVAVTVSRNRSRQPIVLHNPRRRIRTRTLRARIRFPLQLFHPAAVAVAGRLRDQLLRQRRADRRQRVADLGQDEREVAGLASAQRGDEEKQLVEVFLGSGLELAGLDGHAGHDVDEGAGDVEDFFDL